jgi:DNA-binding NtrC family response regulator
MAKKKVALVIDQRGEVSQALRNSEMTDWEFRRCGSVDEARKILPTQRAPVGLMVFDNEAPAPAERLEPLLSVDGMEWIAIVLPDMLKEASLRKLVGQSFLDFHSLPLDHARLRVTIGHAYGKTLLSDTNDEDVGAAVRFGMTGRSPQMQDLYRQIEKMLDVDAPVFIGGESGTGKELVARAIHANSRRAHGPFVAMNCGALPPSLIASELFGHEKGAFTGAHKRKIGRVEVANGGVLFLDEIGDLPLDVQSFLLRFLQEKTIVRIGATEHIAVDVRVIAATHVDLRRAVQEGRFREDLYYRLNVLQIQLAPLRERISDVPLLAERVFRENAGQKNPRVKGISASAQRAMLQHRWPGNVRELINRVQQAMVMSENRLISAADLGLSDTAGTFRTIEEAHAELDRELIETSLLAHSGNLSKAARQLGVSRVTLYKMIDRLNIVL